MSFSITFIGTPKNIIAALKKESEGLTSTSKEEFDAALPGLITLVELNHNSANEPALKLTANGHAYTNTAQKYCSVNVHLENLGLLV